MGAWSKLKVTLEMIKFEHTVFALPFALIGALLASHGIPSARQIIWIVVAMVGARSAAMAFNRIVDVEFDRQNPRTEGRALAAGTLSRQFAVVFTIAMSALFILAAAQLNPLCFYLSFPLLGILLGSFLDGDLLRSTMFAFPAIFVALQILRNGLCFAQDR